MKAGFKCDYCDEFLQDKEEMREHELDCECNPKNRSCESCEHLRCDGEASAIYGGFYCGHRDKQGKSHHSYGDNCNDWK